VLIVISSSLALWGILSSFFLLLVRIGPKPVPTPLGRIHEITPPSRWGSLLPRQHSGNRHEAHEYERSGGQRKQSSTIIPDSISLVRTTTRVYGQ
jgi:hypothetical protein